MNQDIEENLHREGLTLASIKKRSLAFFIDELLLSFLLLLSLGGSLTKASNIEEIILLTNRYALHYIAIKIIYQAFFVYEYGATLGKIVLKIRVVSSQTLQKPDILVAINRSFVRIISEMLFYLGFLWGSMDIFRQTWHDKSAKTLVVNV